MVAHANPNIDRETEIVAMFVALIHARSVDDFAAAAERQKQLERLGVIVRFSRQGVAR